MRVYNILEQLHSAAVAFKSKITFQKDNRWNRLNFDRI